MCEQQDLASVNRSPLARGALTGKYRKERVFAANDVRRDQWSVYRYDFAMRACDAVLRVIG